MSSSRLSDQRPCTSCIGAAAVQMHHVCCPRVRCHHSRMLHGPSRQLSKGALSRKLPAIRAASESKMIRACWLPIDSQTCSDMRSSFFDMATWGSTGGIYYGTLGTAPDRALDLSSRSTRGTGAQPMKKDRNPQSSRAGKGSHKPCIHQSKAGPLARKYTG